MKSLWTSVSVLMKPKLASLWSLAPIAKLWMQKNKLKGLRKKDVGGMSGDISEVRWLEKRRGSLLEQRRVLHNKPGEKMAQKIEGGRKRDRSMSKLSIFGSILEHVISMTVNFILP